MDAISSAGRRGTCGTCGNSSLIIPSAAKSSSYCSCVISPLSFSALSRSVARLSAALLEGLQGCPAAQITGCQFVQQLPDVRFVRGFLGGLVVARQSQRRQYPVQTAADGRVG